MFDLADVGYITRVQVGSSNAEAMKTDGESRAAMDLVNRCLSETPRGRVLGIEKSFALLNIGEHQVVLQWMVYHIGFPSRPDWLTETHPTPP